MSPKGGVRKRHRRYEMWLRATAVRVNIAVVADSGAGSDAKNPLIDTLKLKWCKGKISAKEVEEIIGGATAQGASQLPSLSSPAHPQNRIWRQVSSTALSS